MNKKYRENYDHIDWSKGTGYTRVSQVQGPSKRSSFPAPMVVSDYSTYECPVTGKPIEGRAAHNENLKRHDCRLLEKGEFEDTVKNGQKRISDKIDAAIDQAADEAAMEIL